MSKKQLSKLGLAALAVISIRSFSHFAAVTLLQTAFHLSLYLAQQMLAVTTNFHARAPRIKTMQRCHHYIMTYMLLYGPLRRKYPYSCNM